MVAQPVTKYIHHEREVSVMTHAKGLHRENCLCWNECKFFFPNEPRNCPIAETIYALNKLTGITTPVWECPKYEQDSA